MRGVGGYGSTEQLLPVKEANPYEEAVRPPVPWNFYLIYVGSMLYFMCYSLEGATGSLTLLYFNFKGWGSSHQDRLYVAAMCSQAAMPIYAAPLLGYWATKKQIKRLLVYCQVVSFLGCLLASVANRLILMVLALNMMAVSGYSTQPLRTSYIARTVPAKERTKWQSVLAFTMLLGAALSPFITLACSQAMEPAPMTPLQDVALAYWDVNRYTLVYLTGGALTLVVIAVTQLFFLEYPNDKAMGHGVMGSGELAMAIAEERWKRLPEQDRAYYRRVQTYFAMLFCVDAMCQGMMSVSIYPILGDVFHLNAQRMSFITMALSFLALLPPAIAIVLSRWLADKEIMALGLIVKTIGVVFTMLPVSEYSPLGQWTFIVGYVFVVKASLFFLTSGTSNLTKQLGDQANPQNMSYNVASRNFGNFLGMLITGPFVLKWYHTWAWMVVGIPVIAAWILVITPYFWLRLDPMKAGTPKWIPSHVWARLRVDDDPATLEKELAAMRSSDRKGWPYSDSGAAGTGVGGGGYNSIGGMGVSSGMQGDGGYHTTIGAPAAAGSGVGAGGWGLGAVQGMPAAVAGSGVDLRERNSRSRAGHPLSASQVHEGV